MPSEAPFYSSKTGPGGIRRAGKIAVIFGLVLLAIAVGVAIAMLRSDMFQETMVAVLFLSGLNVTALISGVR